MIVLTCEYCGALLGLQRDDRPGDYLRPAVCLSSSCMGAHATRSRRSPGDVAATVRNATVRSLRRQAEILRAHANAAAHSGDQGHRAQLVAQAAELEGKADAMEATS